MLEEEFKRCIHSDINLFLDEKQVETLEAAARLADALTHKVFFLNKSNLSRTISHNQNQNLALVIRLAVIATHFLPNPNILVKTRIKIPYRNQFAIIAKRQVMLFWKERNCKPCDRVLDLLLIPGKPLQDRYYGRYTVDKKMLITLLTLLVGTNKNKYAMLSC